jgi:AraC family transcriptional regulator
MKIHVLREPLHIHGLALRTSNERAFDDIPRHWQRFQREWATRGIPGRRDGDLFAIYTDFAHPGVDNDGEYTMVIGAAVSADASPADGLVACKCPRAATRSTTSSAGTPSASASAGATCGPMARSTSPSLATMSATSPTARSRSTSACVDAAPTPFGRSTLEREPWRRYERRMRRVIEHVYDHLDQPLDLNAVADVAHLSPHHWHRVYHAMCGETPAQTVRRLRLHRAAGELASTREPIMRVAERAGYPNLQSFTRTFKAEYGFPPAAFRSRGQHSDFVWQRDVAGGAALDVRVQTLPPAVLLGIAHRGSYMAIGRAFDLLFARVAAVGVAQPGMRMFAQFHDDPDLTPEPELRSFAAVAGCGDAPDDAGLQRIEWPGGPHAVVLHTGPYSTMRATYRWLYGRWLPASGYEPVGVGVLEEYLNSPRDTAPQALRTRIALALRTGDGEP